MRDIIWRVVVVVAVVAHCSGYIFEHADHEPDCRHSIDNGGIGSGRGVTSISSNAGSSIGSNETVRSIVRNSSVGDSSGIASTSCDTRSGHSGTDSTIELLLSISEHLAGVFFPIGFVGPTTASLP